MRRSEQRRAAVVALYQHGLTGQSLDEALGPRAQPFTRALAQAALQRGPELDQMIERHSHNWALERIAPLERSIMRVALVEMLDPSSVPGDTAIPAEGAIDEAVQTAKVFCSAEAPAFVNGILAAVLRDLRDNGAQPHDPPDPSP